MTEAEWFTCDDPVKLLEFVGRHHTNERKLRLYAVAGCRRLWSFLSDERFRRAVEVAELFADGAVSKKVRSTCCKEVDKAKSSIDLATEDQFGLMSNWPAASMAAWMANAAAVNAVGPSDDFVRPEAELFYLAANPIEGMEYILRERGMDYRVARESEWSVHRALLRDIFGNPFRPATFDPAWRTTTAVQLAQGMYDSRDFAAMPILADALQDAGCENADILDHCRGRGAARSRVLGGRSGAGEGVIVLRAEGPRSLSPGHRPGEVCATSVRPGGPRSAPRRSKHHSAVLQAARSYRFFLGPVAWAERGRPFGLCRHSPVAPPGGRVVAVPLTTREPVMTRRLTTIAIICAVALAAAQLVPKGATKDAAFRVVVQAKLTFDGDGEEEKLDADASIDYTWKRDGKVRTLVVESLTAKIVGDGEEVMDTKMSRAGTFGTKAGQKADVKFEDAPKHLKTMLTDTFGSPICKIEVDATGKEVKRTVVAGRGAAVLLDNGMIANCTMFHPWYSADKDEWQAVMEAGTDNGVVSGKVTYTKVPGGKGGQAVKVKGTLAADGVKGKDGSTLKDGKFPVTGEQTYDPTRKEWIAGKLTMDVSFKLAEHDKDLATAKGTMVFTLEMLPEKK